MFKCHHGEQRRGHLCPGWDQTGGRGRSFLLRQSFQDGVHLLRNGRQRKLKLLLQRHERREAARNSERERGERGW